MNIERLLDIETALIERRFCVYNIRLLRLNVVTLAISTLLLSTTGRFLLQQQRELTLFTTTYNRWLINGELTLRIVIARIKGFAIARFTLNQMASATLRTSNKWLLFRLFFWLIQRFDVITRWVATTTNEHPKATLP